MAEENTWRKTYNRRSWLQICSLAAASATVPGILSAEILKSGYRYHLPQIQPASISLPVGKSVPFDWPVAELPVNGSSITMKWDKKIQTKYPDIRFRITSATDVREECMLELRLAQSGQKLGAVDIRFAHYMQPFEIILSSGLLTQIAAEGIELKMIKGNKPFWFFVQSSGEVPDAYLPHLLTAEGTDSDAWKKRMLSLASISTFGWMEGCVLDGLLMMAAHDKQAKKVLQQHLEKYFSNNTLVYENLNNQRSAEKITTVESILPFAMLALQNPQHAMLQTAIDFCSSHASTAGVVADEIGANPRLKTEECYTISYPLAILAKMLNRPDLEKMAIASLEARVQLLATNDFIYQNAKEQDKQVYGNWARGVGWYLLGLAKTLAVLPVNDQTSKLRSALHQGAALAMRHQQPDGLWTCFLHQPETGIETSGSASIAAALAYGYAQKLLPSSCKEPAERCLKGLQSYYTPDGFLTGTAQVNKGGEGLQRNGFRVISPYTLGFIGILNASLRR